MFVRPHKSNTSEILQAIRILMNDSKVVGDPIQAYIIPSIDEHQVNE